MTFQTFSFPEENIEYIAPTWDELQRAAFELSKQLLQQRKSFDRLITLAKGGWPMSRSLVDYLSIPEVASVGVKFYSGINTRFSEPQIYQDLPVEVQGERVLLFDDVADTGESLAFTKQYLEERGVAEITSATLFYKPRSTFKPDAFGAETNAWIIFPFERVESLQVLGKKWEAKGVGKQDIWARFLSLGFTNDELTFFLP